MNQENLSRRLFGLGLMGLSFKYMLPPERNASHETKETLPTLHTVNGLHTVPDVNAGVIPGTFTANNSELTIQDAKRLGAHFLTVLYPSQDFILQAKAAGIQLIARTDNIYNRDSFAPFLDLYRNTGMQPIIQVGNEINKEPIKNPFTLTEEIIHPGAYIRDHWIPAAERVGWRNGIILTPPLAQDNGNELTSLNMMFAEIKRRTTAAWRDDHLAIGIHNYIFQPGQNPFDNVRTVHKQVINHFGKPYPIYITESGVSENSRSFSKDEIATETVRMQQMTIPADLPLVCNNGWVHANRGLRNIPPEDEKNPEKKALLDKFDKVAYRIDSQTVNPVFTAIEQLEQEKQPNFTQKLAQEIFPRRSVIFLAQLLKNT